MIGGDVSAGQVPLIDHSKLDSVKELAEPGDADGFFRDLVELFFTRVPVLINEMKEALKHNDATQVSRSAHTLKGTSGNLGAIRVMKIAETLENLARDDKLQSVSELLVTIQEAFILSKEELENNMEIPM